MIGSSEAPLVYSRSRRVALCRSRPPRSAPLQTPRRPAIEGVMSLDDRHVLISPGLAFVRSLAG